MSDHQAAATPAGTRRHAERQVGRGIPPNAYRPLGRTGLVTSCLGFGSYRVDDRTPEQAEALERALAGGINLVDTSTNYMDGASERCIGRALAGHARDEIILVSKVGYVQGQALRLAHERERAGRPFPGMVRYADGCWHCIDPEFLADQLGRSLERLQVGAIDVYLLHNPEYFLADALARDPGADVAALRAEFDDRIRRAFGHLETEVARGRIRWYGVSSNTFVVPADDPEATSLERMWTIAGEVAAAPHFAVAQLPANLFESGAIRTANNAGGRQTALQFAAARDLAVLVNRPLNAFHDGRLIRLADTPVDNPLLHTLVDPFLPAALRGESLSRKALALLANTPGVTAVLNGMRRPAWVDDSLGVLGFPAFGAGAAAYDAVARAASAETDEA